MKEKTKYEVKMGENEVSYQHEKLSKVGCGVDCFRFQDYIHGQERLYPSLGLLQHCPS